MNFDEACQRLKNHANLPNSGPDNESYGLALWHASRGEPSLELMPLFNDVMECLECVNLGLNEEQPSQSSSSPKYSSVDRGLSYSISLIFLLQMNYLQASLEPVQREVAFSMTKDLILAWNFVLAGDIDDISQEVEWSR